MKKLDLVAENSCLAGHGKAAGDPNKNFYFCELEVKINLEGAIGLNNLEERGALMKNSEGCYFNWNNLNSCVICNENK